MKYLKQLTGIVSAVFLLAAVSSAWAVEEPPVFETKWGSRGTGDGEFNSPTGVAVDSDGNVYVADILNYRIQKFNSDGNFTTEWGSFGTGNGEFDYPWGVTVDSDGNVYVADRYNHRIQKFDPSGTFTTEWGSRGTGEGKFDSPSSVAVDSDGNVYVADTNNHRIQKFKPDGNFTTEWGIYGGGNSQFRTPMGVAVDSSGNVYVADSYNHRIQKFNSDGNFTTEWGSNGAGDGQFSNSRGVAVDSSGNVYVADFYNHRIQKFDLNGTFITKWGSWGNGDGEFKHPSGVAVDSSGNVYVAESTNHRIQKFKPSNEAPINQAPIANAGNDQAIISIYTLVQLDGSQSYDLDGDDFTYSWALNSVPGSSIATLSDTAIVNPTFSADVHGTYVAQLTVTDEWGAVSDPDTVTISFDNVIPVADAGNSASVIAGDTVYLDGSGSLDVNLDPLTYSWSIVTKPDGSLALLDDPSSTQPSFVADLPGTYVVNLVVNDGFVDSDPDNITVVAISVPDAVTDELMDTTDAVNILEESVFKNKNLQNALTNKLNDVLLLIDEGSYQEALDKLQNDILGKTNGCADAGSPDKNDWIKDCSAQEQVYSLIMEAIDLLGQLL